MTGKNINYIIDASVAVKWFSEEENRIKAVKILNNLEKRKWVLLAPELLIYEITNALYKGKKLKSKDIKLAINNLFNIGIDYYQLDKVLVYQAVEFMVNYNITFYDSVYGALAFQYNAPLISANPKHHQKIKEIKVIDIAKL